MKTENSTWTEEYQHAKRDPIFFMEEYYNKLIAC